MQALYAEHVFDGTRFLPAGATVIVDGERIVGVESARVDLPDGVDRAEYPGTLLPGLVDCHTHLVADATFGGLELAGALTDDQLDAVILESLRAQAAAGVTTVRDLGDRGYRTLGFRERAGLPRVVAAGPPLTTPGGHCHFLGGAVETDVRQAVADHRDHGVDVIKVMASGGFATPGTDQAGAQFSVSELRSLVAAAHDAGLPAVAHAHSLIGVQNALTAGVDGIEHFTCLTATGPQIEDELLDRVAQQGVYVDLTLGNDRSFHRLMVSPPPQVARLLARAGTESFDDFYRSRIGVLSRCLERGVTVVTGVDSGMGPIKRHGNVWRTVGELVEAGCSTAEALKVATSVTAEACGLGTLTGRLAAGFAADILVAPGDLSLDVSSLGTPERVMIRGTDVDLG
jgi:imidazolonepropionase-like amidohydrolase